MTNKNYSKNYTLTVLRRATNQKIELKAAQPYDWLQSSTADGSKLHTEQDKGERTNAHIDQKRER